MDEDLVTSETFVPLLRHAGIVPSETRNVSIRADEGKPVRIMYDEIEDEQVVTSRRLMRAVSKVYRDSATSGTKPGESFPRL